MGSNHGATATAASRIGMSLEEYERNRSDGLKWCTRCSEWHPVAEFGRDRSRADGLSAKCKRSNNESQRAAYQRRPRPPAGRRYVAARDGDKLQARRRVNHLVDCGVLPRPATLPCTDCGHLGDGPRHEYDHHLGYAPEHHEDVEPVCSGCHHEREALRDERSNEHRMD